MASVSLWKLERNSSLFTAILPVGTTAQERRGFTFVTNLLAGNLFLLFACSLSYT
jgi:hypothetical protein